MKTIHDFGSKIGGARKDVWVKRGLCIEDTKNMTASEKEKYIKRDYIWPKPDTQDELEKGFSRFIVYWHNEMRKTVMIKRFHLNPILLFITITLFPKLLSKFT